MLIRTTRKNFARSLGETLKDINPHTFPRTVIFCSRKSTVSSVFQFLRQCAKDKRCVAMYHASLTEGTKRDIYEADPPNKANL